MPTDHGSRRLHLHFWSTEPASVDAGDRTAVPVWSAVGVGLHLLSWRTPGRSRMTLYQL